MAIIISFAFVETRCRSTEERDGENGRVLIAATMGGFPPFSSSSSSFLTSIVVVTLCLIREKTGFSLDRSFVEKFFLEMMDISSLGGIYVDKLASRNLIESRWPIYYER